MLAWLVSKRERAEPSRVSPELSELMSHELFVQP
uniref:Uncharacterized protein n=1 Tax=Arundo donax TaxID=35708 RepID=A0A0A8YSB8_ARUDO